MIRKLLSHPLTRGLDLDDPRTTHLRRRIIREKRFLRKIYEEWYAMIAAELPAGEGRVLELGSGAGFMNQFVPGLITSEVFACPNVNVVLDARSLPLADASLRAIVMTDVLHHVPHARRFFAEAARCVRVGGAVVMIEPWVNCWSKWVYQTLHHEPFDPRAKDWEFPTSGPLSGANGALPWMIFHRDRARFEAEFPQWSIARIKSFMPVRYALSGGVSMRSLMPAWTFEGWRAIERPLKGLGMFALIKLVKMN